jgi:hypothetical protein
MKCDKRKYEVFMWVKSYLLYKPPCIIIFHWLSFDAQASRTFAPLFALHLTAKLHYVDDVPSHG